MKATLQRLFIVLAFMAGINHLAAQGTAFTYQGRLNSSGASASGNFDFTFALFNNSQTGSQVGASETNLAIGVTNGLFTTTLDFGSVPWSGQLLWMQIQVRTNGNGAFTALLPRQPLTPTPYAIFADTASNVSGTVPAAQIGGTVLNSSLPGSPNFSGTVAATSFAGNGANVTGVNASQLNGLSATNFWQLKGNSGATAGLNFLGTTDNQPLELHVNNLRALRMEPAGPSSLLVGFGYGATNTGAPNVIGGSPVNFVAPGVVGAFIGGGGATNYESLNVPNSIGTYSDFASIGGGYDNIIQTNSGASAIAGGHDNLIQNNDINSFIGAGNNNLIQAYSSISVIAGGELNQIMTNSGDSAIGGGQYNVIQANSEYCTVAGGYSNLISDSASFSSIGGGGNNTIGSLSSSAAISGGGGNTIQSNSFNSTISGGDRNIIQYNSDRSVIDGGSQNDISYGCPFSAIAGGSQNSIGLFSFPTNAFVAGGSGNDADGNYSFAAGHQAQALHQGTFVWADSQSANFPSTGNDQFCIRAHGGVHLDDASGTDLSFGSITRQMLNLWSTSYGIGVQSSTLYQRSTLRFSWFKGGVHSDVQNDPGTGGSVLMTLTSSGLTVNGTLVSASDRNVKENFKPVDSRAVLEKVAALPLSQWSYIADENHNRHLGPMAQDFYAAFAIGPDDKHIAVVDESGVALAAIQGLNAKLEETQRAARLKDGEIQNLKQQNDLLAQRLNDLETTVKLLAEKK